MPTYYEILAVDQAASAAEIRQAYLARARALHPDREAGDARRMQQVNEAYGVLRDPERRAAYDDVLRPAPPRPRVPSAPEEADPDLPVGGGHPLARSLPWLVLALILGTIFVFTAFAGRDTGDPKQELVGQCVVLGRGSELATTSCEEPNNGKVVLVVDRSSHCPDGSEARSIDDRWLCLAAP